MRARQVKVKTDHELFRSIGDMGGCELVLVGHRRKSYLWMCVDGRVMTVSGRKLLRNLAKAILKEVK